MNYRADQTMEAVVGEMRRLGVTRYRRGDLEVELGPPPTVSTPDEDASEALGSGMPAEDDLLFFSAPGPLPSEEREAALAAEKARQA